MNGTLSSPAASSVASRRAGSCAREEGGQPGRSAVLGSAAASRCHCPLMLQTAPCMACHASTLANTGWRPAAPQLSTAQQRRTLSGQL